jgi:hypothetical protein
MCMYASSEHARRSHLHRVPDVFYEAHHKRTRKSYGALTDSYRDLTDSTTHSWTKRERSTEDFGDIIRSMGDRPGSIAISLQGTRIRSMGIHSGSCAHEATFTDCRLRVEATMELARLHQTTDFLQVRDLLTSLSACR